MAVWTLAKKEIRLLLRDPLAAIILVAMPLLFIVVLGRMLGEPDDRLRITVVDQDQGTGLQGEPWSRAVCRDLAETAGIRVEVLPNLEEAQRMVAYHQRPAVLVFKANFSEQINQCSFLAEGINPFHRDGVYLDKVGAEMLHDAKQPGAAAIIDQVAQVSLMRVILPWMIGRAFEKLSDPSFLSVLAKEAQIPPFLLTEDFKKKMGTGIKIALQRLFSKYNLTGKTWASLTKSQEEGTKSEPEGLAPSRRRDQLFQMLVPSNTVMFGFFMVIVVGWVFVTERRQGTLKRLRAAPITRGELMLGKLIPWFLLSLGQGAFLLLAGRFVFGMRWGPASWDLFEQIGWLVPVLVATSLAAMGMSFLVAAVARTEIQVVLFGALPVLVMAMISGCLLPREMMPEQAQQFALLTPQGWALDAYRELLGANPDYTPNIIIVLQACGVLIAFGLGFLALAWALLRLD
jgi:ABC-type multidrug transport system permease subunit